MNEDLKTLETKLIREVEKIIDSPAVADDKTRIDTLAVAVNIIGFIQNIRSWNRPSDASGQSPTIGDGPF